MSWDLTVYASRQAALVHVIEALALSVELRDDAFVVMRRVRGRPEVAFVGDGPLRVEREDLPQAVAAAGVGLRFSYELSVPEGAPAAVREAAGRLARQVAETTRGVVYDPQEDRVTWPRATRRRHRPPATERVTTVDLQWFFIDDPSGTVLPRLFDVLRAWWPEGMPRRFGSHEPLQHHFDEDGLEGLLALSRGAWGSVYWSATRPFHGGSVDIQRRPDATAGDGRGSGARCAARPVVSSASLTVDARVHDDEAWRRDLIEGFVRAADRTDSVYAQAQPTHGWGFSGGRLWADARTELWYRQVIRPDGQWLGLPSDPVWLGWLGRPYAHLGVGVPAGRGRLVVAAAPTARPDAPPRAPLPVPSEWVVRNHGGSLQPAVRLPHGLGPGST